MSVLDNTPNHPDTHPDAATNVFEWCWEHSRARPTARHILLTLAFETEDPPRNTWPGYWHPAESEDHGCYLDPRPHIRHLELLGELALTSSADLSQVDLHQPSDRIRVSFPAYQAWLNTQAVTG